MKCLKSILKPRQGGAADHHHDNASNNHDHHHREWSSSDDAGLTDEEPSNPSDSARSLVDVNPLGSPVGPVPGSPVDSERSPLGVVGTPVGGTTRRRILFGKVTTHVFDKKRPPCTAVTGRQSRPKHPGVGAAAVSRWDGCSEGVTSSPGKRSGGLMPFLPRRRSSDDAPNNKGSATNGRQTMRDAAALIDDPSRELGKDASRQQGQHHSPSRSHCSPILASKRGGGGSSSAVCRLAMDCAETLRVDSRDVGNESPRRPSRRVSADAEQSVMALPTCDL